MRPGPDWFNNGYAEACFRRHLLGLAGQDHLRALQIGAYCGDASVWLMENVLTSSTSTLIDVDTWKGSNESAHEAIDFDEVMSFYLSRIAYQVSWVCSTSDEFFASWRPQPFDFIYVDGSHEPDQVLRDAVNAHSALAPGGLLAFDDYTWTDGTRDHPKPAIDAYLRCYENQIDVLETDLQVWVRKRIGHMPAHF